MQIIADNLHIINPRISDAVFSENPSAIKDLVKKISEVAVHGMDINTGPLNKHPEEKMLFFLEVVTRITHLPLLLDTVNPKALDAGLEFCREKKRKCIINGFSLEPKKLENILPLAKKYNVDIIGYLLYPNSMVPPDENEMMDTALLVYEAFMQTGLSPEHLILDPIVAPLSWDNGIKHNKALISVVKNLPDLLGFPVRTICGLSNLTSGAGDKEKRIVMESAFAAILSASGLDFALMDVFNPEIIKIIKAADALTNSAVFSWAELD